MPRARDLRDVGTEPDPRFSFANERTFLAWVRTSLALVAGGLAVTQLLPAFDIAGGRQILGVPLLALGAITAYGAYRRWYASERALRLEQPLPQSYLLEVVATAVALIAIVGFVFVLLAAG